MKSDAENDAVAAKLPSFDITSLLYHADRTAFTIGYLYELVILREAQRFFDWCYHNKAKAKALRTPDGTRYILDTDEKFDGLTAISVELDDLVKRVVAEQLGVNAESVTPEQADALFRSLTIPKAA